jgi:hypothetical protein
VQSIVLDVGSNNRRAIPCEEAKGVRSRSTGLDRGFGRVLAGGIPRDVLQTLYRKGHERRSFQSDLLLSDVVERNPARHDESMRTTEFHSITRQNIELIAERSAKVLDLSLVLCLGAKHELLVAHKKRLFRRETAQDSSPRDELDNASIVDDLAAQYDGIEGRDQVGDSLVQAAEKRRGHLFLQENKVSNHEGCSAKGHAQDLGFWGKIKDELLSWGQDDVL